MYSYNTSGGESYTCAKDSGKIKTIARNRNYTKKGTNEMSTVDSTEARLNTHEQICAERYKGIELRMGNIDDRFIRLESDVREIKENTTKSLNEIKSMLSTAKDEKFKVMITSTATVLVGLLALLGYIVSHLK